MPDHISARIGQAAAVVAVEHPAATATASFAKSFSLVRVKT